MTTLPHTSPRRGLNTLCAALLLADVGLAPGVSFAQEELRELQMPMTAEWQLVKDDRLRNIRTFARLEPGKRFRSFKVEAMVSASPETLARLMLDFSSYPRWYWSVRESRLLKQVSPTEYFLYLVHNAPYGMPDRDVILHAVVEPQTATQPHVLLRVRAEPDYMPLQPPLVRMPAEDMNIRFTPQPDDRILIESEGYVDPGGKVPSWASNFVQRSAPYGIIVNIQRMVEKEEYVRSNAPLPFPVFRHGEAPAP
ncbi:hypothetical protein EV700_2337 [Fluviicoccus keumensis]|uniref:START domain-containing protein n=1 Tax=Fluviicoccus keumensis TaxID=1435465 RepID=A0A4V2G3V1_9GAMM|nr:hypothetical protein [Fluviicoccus keumensis]RZU38406.1 hypothetical protein EV700_2337 [Fluviicoccus keumensis]